MDIPIILYNVPGRTGLNLLPRTVLELSGHKNIVAIKDATGNLSETTEVARLTNECIDIYSGNDDVVVPVPANLAHFLRMCPEGLVCGIDFSTVSVAHSLRKNADAVAAGRCEVRLGNASEIGRAHV